MEMRDSLTGMFNKWGFFFRVQEILREDTTENYQIICTNVRYFMLVNDLFGFAAGDRLIHKIGDHLKANGPRGAVYARLEGDKFGVLVPEKYAEKVIRSLLEAEMYADDENTYLIHFDVGVYEIDNRDIPVSLMCDRANMALATLKGKHRKQVAYFKETMREQMLKEQALHRDLQRALRNKEMVIYLQGLYDSEQKVVGAEALVRWNHPERGILSAGEFIPSMEKSGMIDMLDLCIWDIACLQLKKWQDEGRTNLFLSVNISAKDFETMDVCEVLSDMVDKYGIPAEKLRLELTETAIMEDVERNLRVIENLREQGFIVEIDDFGSGYSSLNTLKDIVVDTVKLDMKFLQKCRDEERSKTILQAMVELVKKLGMQVIVEGVETKEQFEMLKEYCCDVYQGYYLMRPMTVEKFEEIASVCA